MRKSFIFSISLILLFAVAYPALAYHQQQVLGDSTVDEAPQIPPTAEGPGLILPDSPLFFLDQLKQQTRLLFALTPEAKAKVYTDIAGERMAELRFMLAKNNKEGIDIDLAGVTQNLQKAGDALAKAKLLGRDVSLLAIAINDNIKNKQEAFDALEVSDNREIVLKARAAQESLFSAKITVEDSLPEDRIEAEITADFNRIVEKEAFDAASSQYRLQSALDVLGVGAKANDASDLATPSATPEEKK